MQLTDVVKCLLRNSKVVFRNENMTGFPYISSNHPCGLGYTHATRLALVSLRSWRFCVSLNGGAAKTSGEAARGMVRVRVSNARFRGFAAFILIERPQNRQLRRLRSCTLLILVVRRALVRSRCLLSNTR